MGRCSVYAYYQPLPFWGSSARLPRRFDNLAPMKGRRVFHRRRIVRAALGALLLACLLALSGCGSAWNNPYPTEKTAGNTLYLAFRERPKHLDPARSYSLNESTFTGSIYEPPLHYDYLKRPYTLAPLSATQVPEPQYLDAEGRPLPRDADPSKIAYSVYTIHIKHGLYYQPHPAFAKNADGRPLYWHLTRRDMADIQTLGDFKHTGTREATAADFVYEIKRLADPRVQSPIYSVMAQHIVGMKAFHKRVQRAEKHLAPHEFLDLSNIPLKGVRVVNRYTYRIKVKKRYPQLLYWLAMSFFAPMPKEAVRFYHQPGMAKRNLNLDWYPVGTGPYMLTENNPNLRMVMVKNPNFHGERYPEHGMKGDRAKDLLADAGKPLPFIDKIVFSLERESIPYWDKFLQGYYDESGISSSSFDKAINFGSSGEPQLTRALKAKGIELQTAVQPAIFYLGFNMLDDVVGGDGERARKLRRAISIALSYQEFVATFLNGRGVVAQGPIPPGIFGHEKGKTGLDPYVFQWKDGEAKRKPIRKARKLLAEAGYPDGVNEKTGKPLLLHLDVVAGGAQSKAQLDWYQQQFAKLNVQLAIRSTSYNRFQDKMRRGDTQMFTWGWIADYPDPQNFLFLLYGPNGEVKHGGENVSNYDNPTYNRLYKKMRGMPDGPKRQAVIDKMVHIVQRDAPWVWGFFPKQYSLYQGWVHNAKLNAMAHDTVKYLRLNPKARAHKRQVWNHPLIWPLGAAAGALVLVLVPAVRMYRRKEKSRPRRRGGD
jgi:ABC-type transport system substrate-binding protein